MDNEQCIKNGEPYIIYNELRTMNVEHKENNEQ